MQSSGRCVGLTKLQVNEFHRLEFKGGIFNWISCAEGRNGSLNPRSGTEFMGTYL